ncbi:MAG: CPBP family glutamic-type intramembrane protease [Trueperaceae bacterium]|nr:CPBP family glutamic-type intramembrane protease [Trueperaceae bacterium]
MNDNTDSTGGRRVVWGSPLPSRLHRAFTTWPSWRGWRDVALITLVFAALAVPIGLSGGLLTVRNADVSVWGALAVVGRTLFTPSLFEETVFRVMLFPHPAEDRSRRHRLVVFAVALGIFVVWHVINAWLITPAARPVFYDPIFLIDAGLLGAACLLAYWRTGSVWAPVAVHWVAVVGWQLGLGGIALLERL